MESKTKRRLGRGLEALLGPSTVEEARAEGDLATVPMDRIQPNPFQPRQVFDESALDELTKSMAQSGLLQPVVLRPAGDGYEIIAGERRFRAAGNLEWKEIPAVIREVDDRTLLTLALVENLQRDALSPIDEALGYQRLIEDFGATQSDVAQLTGRDRSTVANALRLLKLPDHVQHLVHAGRLSTGHARALLQLDDPKRMPVLAERAISEDLSVRELEAAVRGARGPARRPRKSAAKPTPNAEVQRVEDALRRRLGTDVYLTPRTQKSGRLTINYYSNDDLTRILELVLGQPYDG